MLNNVNIYRLNISIFQNEKVKTKKHNYFEMKD